MTALKALLNLVTYTCALTSAHGTKQPLFPVIVSRTNRSILENDTVLRGAFQNLTSNIVSHISEALY